MTVDLKTPVSRADLAWMLACGRDEEERSAFVKLLGYEAVPKPDNEPPESVTASSVSSQTVSEQREAAPPLRGAALGFWRVISAEIRDDENDPSEPPWLHSAHLITRERLRSAARPEDEQRPFPFLTPWRRLWPFLKRELSRIMQEGRVDVDRLVWDIAALKPIRRMPRKRVMRWAQSVHVLVDRSDALAPFWDDMSELVFRLSEICGRHRLKVFVFPTGLDALGYESGTRGALCRYRAVEGQTAVLALSDLAAGAPGPHTVGYLVDLGRSIARSGGRLVALTPFPEWRWFPLLLHDWHAARWELGQKPRVLEGRKERSASKLATLPKPSERNFRFLRLTAPIVKRDAALLRYIRALLPPAETHAGMESDIYTGKLDPRPYLGELRCEPFLVREALVKLLIWYHGDFPEILNEELNIIENMDEEMKPVIAAAADTRGFNADIVASLDGQKWQQAGFTKEEFLGYMARRQRRLPDQAFADPRVAAAWAFTHLTEDGKLDGSTIPGSLPMSEIEWVLGRGERRNYRLIQSGKRLAVQSGKAALAASPLAEMSSRSEVLFIKATGPGTGRDKTAWSANEPGLEILTHEYGGCSYAIESGSAVLHLEQTQKPWWAEEMGRDANGLFVVLLDKRRFYWMPPGSYWVYGGHGAGRFNQVRGAWVSEKSYLDYLKNRGLSLGWDEHLGEDEFGLYEDVPIFGITQRFSWIPPGEFLMGSPESEKERSGDERQHEVVLTQGFWLADTACTQALWQAVMGKNPSNFKGDKRPVEQVSWDDCRKFFERVNTQMPELNLRFPTEAEWEYACRAGTVTPFSFGENVTTDQVNYDGNYPYEDGAKGKWRQETVPVKSLPPNGWGLYEMHGNVYEWCADWFGEYPPGGVVDPSGPEKGVYRVLRGGSWVDYGRDCRSAYRLRSDPGVRSNFVGLRLSRGQVEQVKSAEPRSAAPEAKRSEAGDAPRDGGFLSRVFGGKKKKKK